LPPVQAILACGETDPEVTLARPRKAVESPRVVREGVKAKVQGGLVDPLLIEPGIFPAIAGEHTVDHDRQALDIGLPARPSQ